MTMLTILAITLLVGSAFYRKWEHLVSGTCFGFNRPSISLALSFTKPISIVGKRTELTMAALVLAIVILASEVLFFESGGFAYMAIANGIALFVAYHTKRSEPTAEKTDAA
jgi:hypothetical protein